MNFVLELTGRILLACLCGLVIGIERTVRLKEAGIRTHTIVALGSALMMIVSKYGFTDIAQFGGSFDGSRIASNIITGISFLGAGIIFVRGSTIKGLTTSAGIWATAGIGIAIGAGMYLLGIISTVLLLFLQLLLHRFVGGLDSMALTDISLTVVYTSNITERIKTLLADRGMTVQKCHAEKGQDNTISFRLTVKSKDEIPFETMVDMFEKNDDIISFSI